MDTIPDEIARRFVSDLVELRLRAGEPSYSTLERASDHALKRATVSDHLNGKRANLPDWPFVSTFVTACRSIAQTTGLDLRDLGTIAEWKQHWDAAKRGIIDSRYPGSAHRVDPPAPPEKTEQVSFAHFPEPSDRHASPPAIGASEPVWGPVPPPPNDFVGRESVLDELHRAFHQDDRAGALAIQGVAGVGKTQLAAMYAHRYRTEYDLVWWISCGSQELAHNGMAELASRLGVTASARVPGENIFGALFDELRLGQRYRRWLLVFDDANEPQAIRYLIPPDRQNVLITSRNYEWSATESMLELDVFERGESVEFLSSRRRGLSEAEAQQIADSVGDLPLVLEHAVESQFQPTEYLSRLERDPFLLFSENPPSAYPVTVAEAWLSVIERLRMETPDAMVLLGCLTFFASDPIPRESLERGRFNHEVSVREVLGPLRFSRAIAALRRVGLLSVRPGIRPATSRFHVHRLTQRLVRSVLTAAEAERLRHDVHLLIAAADPASPDDFNSWPQYDELRSHMGESDVMECSDAVVRRLVVNQVRYLRASGDPKAALGLAREALDRWASGIDIVDLDPAAIELAMYRAEAEVLCSLGTYERAFEVAQRTLGKMSSASAMADWSEDIPVLGRMRGTRLRLAGDFEAALTADTESLKEHIDVFGRDDPQTFMAMYNLAVDNLLVGNHVRATMITDETYHRSLIYYGGPDHPSVLFHQNSSARCNRLLGQFDLALAIADDVHNRYRTLIDSGAFSEYHPLFLMHQIDFIAAQRDMGASGSALDRLAEENYQVYLRCWRTLDRGHLLTLAAAITHSSLLQRMDGRMDEAAEAISDARHRYISILGQDHPYVRACEAILTDIQGRVDVTDKSAAQSQASSELTLLLF